MELGVVGTRMDALLVGILSLVALVRSILDLMMNILVVIKGVCGAMVTSLGEVRVIVAEMILVGLVR